MTAPGRLLVYTNGGGPALKIMQLGRPIAGIGGRLLPLKFQVLSLGQLHCNRHGYPDTAEVCATVHCWVPQPPGIGHKTDFIDRNLRRSRVSSLSRNLRPDLDSTVLNFLPLPASSSDMALRIVALGTFTSNGKRRSSEIRSINSRIASDIERPNASSASAAS